MPEVIDPRDLDHLIRWHQDNTSSYAHLMSPSVRYLEQQTVKALKHYRAITAVIPECQKVTVNPDD